MKVLEDIELVSSYQKEKIKCTGSNLSERIEVNQN